MKISVCIPTYNRLDFLQEAVSSCLSQTFLPYEVLIGDDSKNDDSKNYIESLINSKSTPVIIRYYKHPISLGQLANVNSLIDKAEGDKFVLLHDDDLFFPDALETMINVCRKDNSIQVVYGKQLLIGDDGSDVDNTGFNERFFRTKKYEGHILTSAEAAIVQQFPNDGYMIDMKIVKDLKYGKKESVGNAGDFDFGLRLGLKNLKFYYVDHFTAKYRISNESVARNGTDSAYQSFKLIAAAPYTPKGFDYKAHILKTKAPMAIVQALRKGRKKEAFSIYFSKWHGNKIFTLGGIKRFLLLIFKF